MKLNEAEELRDILLGSAPILFLGAGFSKGAKCRNVEMQDGGDLKEHIFETLIKDHIDSADYEEIKGYNLRKTCEEVYSVYNGKNELTQLLTKCFKGTYPVGSKFHLKLTDYPWRKIYTVNIDDLVENIYQEKGLPCFVQNKSGLMCEPEDATILYKLHGCVNRPDEGYIFSETEYLDLITKKMDAKLNLFAGDIQHSNVIFVGASMDEPDIQYYLKLYQDAECKFRKNKLFFIDYKPSRALKTMVKKLNAVLIEASAEDFLNYISQLNYQPNALDKAVKRLNYQGVFRLQDIKQTYEEIYDSKLYAGDFCRWQDVAENWLFLLQDFNAAVKQLEDLIAEGKQISCFSIYGIVFTGKSCLLKALAYYLADKNYEVLEYHGKRLDRESLWAYMSQSPHNQFVVVIDNGSYYYEQIEKMFTYEIEGKKIVILTASREYYHKKKRYYLEGNPYKEFEMTNSFTRVDAQSICDKLEEKTHLSFMASIKPQERAAVVYQMRNMVNFVVGWTRGSIPKRMETLFSRMFSKLNGVEQRLITELVIFDMADIAVFPRELFTERYGRQIRLDIDQDIEGLRVVDYVRMDEYGLSLRNSILDQYIVSKRQKELPDSMIDVLKYVSRYVSESNNDVWYMIFQCLLKEDVLEKKFKLNWQEIRRIYLSVKEEYRSISYYWLQLGLLLQKIGDYVAAYNYLEMSSSIRPNSYKIQHALARNFMRYANHTDNTLEAVSLFEKGEKLMKQLIESKEYGKQKAKPFSVSSYISEKIKFLVKHKLAPTDAELKYMNTCLNNICPQWDSYLNRVFESFYAFLEERNRLDILSMDLNSPYLQFVGRKNQIDMEEDFEDPIVEAIN